MCNVIGSVFYVLGASGYMTYIPRYIEIQFKKSAAIASGVIGKFWSNLTLDRNIDKINGKQTNKESTEMMLQSENFGCMACSFTVRCHSKYLTTGPTVIIINVNTENTKLY